MLVLSWLAASPGDTASESIAFWLELHITYFQ